MTGHDLLMYLLDERKVIAMLDRLHDEDKQSADLLASAMRQLSRKFDLPANEQGGLSRLINLMRDGQHWDVGLLRNNVFKIANSMGMKLPSGMFASQKTAASDLEKAYWGCG